MGLCLTLFHLDKKDDDSFYQHAHKCMIQRNSLFSHLYICKIYADVSLVSLSRVGTVLHFLRTSQFSKRLASLWEAR